MKSTCQFQPEQLSICQVVESKQYNSTKRANEFGINVDDNLTAVNARVLPPPNHDSGSEKTWSPMNGYWNMKDKKVVNGAKIRNWACFNFCEDLSKNAVEQFCFKLAEMSRITGVELADLKLPVFTARPDQVEDDIRICYQEAQKELRDQKIDLLLAILPDNNGSLYGNIKKICETDIGVMSQCCRKSIVFTKYNKILANIAIKINAKAGGRNSVFEDAQKSSPVVSNKPTIIFGAHVTHPSVVNHSAPSIASVVASQDWHEVDKYNGVVRAQGQREEMIGGLEDMVKELLHAFEKESDRKPQQLIFYRDGVSGSQLKQVFEK
ncbi:protein argonaute 18-like [Panicum miliaceum]|uniref:Protein argonaute 18-like n=1 Tax=Panicum miliaceum TaxID=4540 RepID=A0A3L6QL44_PANMI|nr:protein argonaute 18-like [Panicum miliaceum]